MTPHNLVHQEIRKLSEDPNRLDVEEDARLSLSEAISDNYVAQPSHLSSRRVQAPH